MLTTAGWLYSLPVRRMRLVAAPLTAVVLLLAATTISGCGSMGRAREIVTGRTPVGLPTIAPVDTPDANLANHPVVAATKSSVVKIRGMALLSLKGRAVSTGLPACGFAGFRPPGRQHWVRAGVKTERPQRSEDERS